jgi:ribosomal protein S18 acetylase RimI-like enzyme
MSTRWTSNNTRLRRYTDADIPFMKALYCSTREQELQYTPFTSAQADAFIEQQFQAQLTHYTTHYCRDRFDIIEVEAKPAGRLFVDYGPGDIRIVDISLAPPFRSQGLGEYLLRTVIAQSQQLAVPVTIHVEHQNPARRLYERLGFRVKDASGQIYLLMERLPRETLTSPSCD